MNIVIFYNLDKNRINPIYVLRTEGNVVPKC